MRLVLLAPLSLLLACADSATVDGNKHGGGRDSGGDDTGEDFSSPFTGAWTGTAGGYAQFYDDWETAPYCEGAVTATVAATGAITGSGECEIIAESPYQGELFDVTLSGQVTATGELALDVTISEETESHGFGDTAAVGTGDATAKTLSAEGDTMYYPTGLDAILAFVRVELAGS
ncbi:hypothetical protein LBMAG42_05660 [Deltaproteobacteria bacterium]|nr:hypothetical protein LBMAG42_05660 [Deltaproteobacteria bacterium]